MAIRFAIDPRRVYLSGFSNGSMLCHWFAVESPGIVAAIGAVSGGLSAIPSEGCARPPAVRIVHGFLDDHVPFEGGVGSAALDPYEHVAIQRTESWWRGMGATSCGWRRACPDGRGRHWSLGFTQP